MCYFTKNKMHATGLCGTIEFVNPRFFKMFTDSIELIAKPSILAHCY